MSKYGTSRLYSKPTPQNIKRWQEADAFKASLDTALKAPDYAGGFNGCHHDISQNGLFLPQKLEDLNHNPITVKMRKIQVLDNLHNYIFIGNYTRETILDIIKYICDDPNLSEEDKKKRDQFLAGKTYEEAYEIYLVDYLKTIKGVETQSSLRLYYEPFCICPVGELFIRNRIGPLVDFETGFIKTIKPPYLEKNVFGRHGLFTNGLSDKKIMSIKHNFR